MVTFSVSATGTGTLSYQWRRNSFVLLGATNSSYTIDPVNVIHAGNYDVVVTNLCGSTTSATASLTVNRIPNIFTQPVAQSTCVGNPVSFTATASGTPPLSFQWRKDGVDIPGATGNFFSIPSPAPSSKS